MELRRRLIVAAGILGSFCPLAGADEQVQFVRGDANADGKISISDALTIRRYLFTGGLAPSCLDTADADDNGFLNLNDQLRVYHAVFSDTLPLPPTFGVLAEDPTPEDGIPCDSYDVVEPLQTEDVIRLGDVTGAPGQEVEIPVYLSNSVEVEAFQLMVRYEPSVFEPSIFGPRRISDTDPHNQWSGLSFDGTFYEFLNSYPGLEGFLSVTLSPEEGVFAVGFIPDVIHTGLEVPPGQDRLIFKILGNISETALPGTVVSLEPINGPGGAGIGPYRVHNEVTHRGDGRYVSLLPRTFPGILQIVPDLSIFRRADSNLDQKVDLSDAQFTLSYLFLGSSAPICMDAADVNDDGKIDLSDPVATLGFLFLGQSAPPPPGLSPGSDPTDDLLECATD